MADYDDLDAGSALAGGGWAGLCLSNLLDLRSDVHFYFKDLEGRIVLAGWGAADVAGRSPQELVGLTDADLTDPDHAAELLADERRIIATGEPMLDKLERDPRPGNEGRSVETSKFPLRQSDGVIVGTFGFTRDVTRRVVAERAVAELQREHVRFEQELARTSERLSGFLYASPDEIAVYDRQQRYEFVNPAGLRARGLPLATLLGRTDRDLGRWTGAPGPLETSIADVLRTGATHEIDVPSANLPGGSHTWMRISVQPNRDVEGAVTGAMTIARDITSEKLAAERLVHRATHDPLTGLANRVPVAEHLDTLLHDSDSHPGAVAVAFVDVDHFKHINDRLGHRAGDEVLVEVARRLRGAIGPRDVLARMGGDEFVVIRHGSTEQVDGAELGRELCRSMRRPMVLRGLDQALSVSIGIAVTHDPTRTRPGTVLGAADGAMYLAKRRGRGRFELTTLPLGGSPGADPPDEVTAGG